MVKLNNKIKAFTILESMVAMVIVMIVFSLSSIVVINVSSSGVTQQKRTGHTLIRALRNETLKEKRFIDEVFTVEEMTIEKQILDYPGNEHLKVLLIEALIGTKKVIVSKELVLVNE